MNRHELTKTGSSKGQSAFDSRVEKVMEAVGLYHQFLLGYIYRMTRQWQDAEDILQQLWSYVVVNFPEEKIASLPLLKRKSYQLFIDHYRSAKRRAEVMSEQLADVPVANGTETSFSQEQEAKLKAKFWQEFSGIDLTENQKDVLWLHARYGFTYQEIQQQTGVASSTVGDWIVLGRQRIADYLNAKS